MKKRMPSHRFSSLIFQLPLFVVLFCLILGTAGAFVGYRVFKSLFEEQYESITRQIAYTALSYIDADRLAGWAGGDAADESWNESNGKLNTLTSTAELAYIYVTVPDADFTKRTYIFDTVNPKVESTVIPFGHVSSLEKYDGEYIDRIKQVMLEGKPCIRFVYNGDEGHVTTSVPVIDSGGKVVGILGIVKPMSEIRSFKTRYLRTTLATAGIITLVLGGIYILVLLFVLIRPLITITKETSQFASHQGILSGALQRIGGNNELSTLARSVETMAVDMRDYIDRLTKTTAEKERISAELDVAKQIQANMLPRIFPPCEDPPEIELFASMVPAKEVGGDFYDFYMVDDDHFALLVGDVSGKGVPAAMFMVIAKTLLKNLGRHGNSPAEVFRRVNNQLCEGNDAGLFVTCWMGVLSLSTGELVFANAGHPLPIAVRGGRVSFVKEKPDLVLAAIRDTEYTDYKVTLNPGDRLFVYSDGVTESTDKENRLFGEERLVGLFSNDMEGTPQEDLERVKNVLDVFAKDVPQFDDVTMLEMLVKERRK